MPRRKSLAIVALPGQGANSVAAFKRTAGLENADHVRSLFERRLQQPPGNRVITTQRYHPLRARSKCLMGRHGARYLVVWWLERVR
jgi:hypothetical protein